MDFSLWTYVFPKGGKPAFTGFRGAKRQEVKRRVFPLACSVGL